MNRLTIIFIFIIFLRLPVYGQWKILSNGSGPFVAIDFVSGDVGWISGLHTLLKTTDGGETWSSVPIDRNFVLRSIDFIDESVGWSLCYRFDADTEDQVILKSEDGGFTWIVQKVVTGMNALYVIDRNVVFVVGEGKILRTLNGGMDWIDISPDLINRTLGSIRFINANVGTVTGYYNDGSGDNKGLILSTIDGGETWNEKILPEFFSIENLQFINDSTGYFVGNGIDGRFFCVTTDTLNSWTMIPNPIQSYFVSDDNAIFAVMDNDTSFVIKSTDGGRTWEKKQNILGGSSKIFFTENNIGFVFNIRCLYKSIDGGENWSIDKINCNLNDIFFVDKNIGYASGGEGVHIVRGNLFYTVNGGQTWHHNLEIKRSSFYSCSFVTDSVGFIAAGRAGIYKTTDRGNSWTSSHITNPDSIIYELNIRDLCFRDEKNGSAVGFINDGRAAIMSTADGGKSWSLEWKYSKKGWKT